MDKQTITSTSQTSAQCSDIVLRETAYTRLVFRPELVENPGYPDAVVKGTFIFQRKGPNDDWGDTTTIPLSTLHKDEGYRLELHSAEVLNLFGELADLYRVHATMGIPMGTTEYVRVDSLVSRVTQLGASDLRGYLTANETLGAEVLAMLLTWATEAEDPLGIIQRLIAIAPNTLRNLNAAVGLETLKAALSVWDDNRDNPDEEFWQQFLGANSFLLEQVFSWPVTIVKGKAYVGGKSVLNTGGGIVDFLVKNQITCNAGLVEIKTPAKALLGSLYRGQIYNISGELSGGVQQIANYRNSLQIEINTIAHSLPRLSAFAPRCVVLIGNATTEFAADTNKTKAFELYRSNMTGVTIVTFDELFQKTRDLVEVLETPATAEATAAISIDSNAEAR